MAPRRIHVAERGVKYSSRKRCVKEEFGHGAPAKYSSMRTRSIKSAGVRKAGRFHPGAKGKYLSY